MSLAKSPKTFRKLQFAWTLKHFANVSCDDGVKIESPYLKIDRRSWKVVLDRSESFSWNISVKQTKNSYNEERPEYFIAILNTRNEIIKSKNETLLFSFGEGTTYFDKDGTIIVFVEFKVQPWPHQSNDKDIWLECSYMCGNIPEFNCTLPLPSFPCAHKSYFQEEEIQWLIKSIECNFITIVIDTSIEFINAFQIFCKINESTHLFYNSSDYQVYVPYSNELKIVPIHIIKKSPLIKLVKEIPIKHTTTGSDLKIYKKFFQNELYSDISITVEDKALHVHKIVLAAHSPVF